MESIIKELWHGNIIPHEDSRTNSKEMKELLGYIARHHEDLEKSFTDEQKKSSKSSTIVGASTRVSVSLRIIKRNEAESSLASE